jgi:hypothetical protein
MRTRKFRMRSMIPRAFGFLCLAVVLAMSCRTENADQSQSYTLTVRVTGQGTVSPSGATYDAGTVVTLTATAGAGYRLASWKGTDNDASTETTNTVTMTADKTVDVTFISLIIEDFEGSSAPADWVFSNGPEFPGATGGFAVVGGRGRSGSKGGVVRFSFAGGGNYVIVARTFTDPVQTQGVFFWISGYVPGTRVLVRLTDESNQVFQYFPAVGSVSDSGWFQVGALLSDWDSYWGGSADGVFHGGIRACGIGVEKGIQFYRTGEMVIDDLAELGSAEIALDPFGQDALPEFFLGPVSSLIGVNIHFIRPQNALLDLAREAGFGFVRMDLFWDRVEKSAGQYDFSEYDMLVNALEARGLGALFILDYANPLYYDGPGAFNSNWGPQTQSTRTAYAKFAVAAAQRYSGRPVSLEVWNEPNLSQFWAPSPDPADYRLLADATVKAVRGKSAGVPVVVGATSGCDASFLDQVFALSSLSAVDAVSIHPYRSSSPETFLQERLLVQDVLKRRTLRDDIPLYSGEWGYSSSWFGGRTASAWNTQAVQAVRLILFNILSQVPKTVWYDLQDDGSNPANAEHNFGLLTNGTPAPKPAYNAIKTLSDLLPGRDADPPVNSWSVSAVNTRVSNVYGLVFQNGRGRLAVLWTGHKRGGVDVRMPAGSSPQFFDMFGRAMTSVRVENGYCFFSLEGTKGPLYVKD